MGMPAGKFVPGKMVTFLLSQNFSERLYMKMLTLCPSQELTIALAHTLIFSSILRPILVPRALRFLVTWSLTRMAAAELTQLEG